MNVKIVLLSLLVSGLASHAAADTRAGVWVYQPDGNSYRIENQPRQYDPRSPYPQHRQYPQNLPPRYQGQLPPRYYDRHPRQERYEDRYRDRFEDRRPRWEDRYRHEQHRSPRWQQDRRADDRRPPIINGRGYRLERRDDHPQRPYSGGRERNW